MSKAITFLHLSDRHTNRPGTGWDARRVIDSLVTDLRRLQNSYGLSPDLLFFTGDLAWGQLGVAAGQRIADQFAEGETFLNDVRQAFHPAISRGSTFLVPGNHDVNRSHVAESETLWQDQHANLNSVTTPSSVYLTPGSHHAAA